MLRAIAFHTPEVDWAVVAAAAPAFAGHDQPRRPSELGCYGSATAAVRMRQAGLAHAHGIHGFCYRFDPERDTVDDVLVDFPFCLCWSSASAETANVDRFIRAVIRVVRDDRYIRVDGRPLVAVDRVDELPGGRQTIERWRDVARGAGLPDLHLCALQTGGIADPRPWGCDAAVEIPPYPSVERAGGALADYRAIARQALQKPTPDYRLYRGVMPFWDDTPVRRAGAVVTVHGSPLDYRYWLRRLADETRRDNSGDAQLVFINAWNDWEHGCYLEPDMRYGRAYLETTRSALDPADSIEELLKPGATTDNGAVARIRAAVEARERSLGALQDVIRGKDAQIAEMEVRLGRLAPYETNPLGALARRQLARYPGVKHALKRLLGRA